MGSNPVFSYKTSTVGSATTGAKNTATSGKANTAPASGTSAASPTDNYLDQLESLGNAKLGKQTPPKTDSGSGDPVADLLNTLDQVSGQGTPGSGIIPFAKISAESALSKFPESPEDVLSKFNSVISILQKKLSDIDTALANGGGTPQQVAAAQQLKSELADLLSYYKIQSDKAAAIVVEKQKFWDKELQNFKETGGKSSVEKFDKDDDGWIGRPEAKGSYRIGIRTFDKKYVDPVAKKMVGVALDKKIKLDLKYEFKKGEKQYWAINPETNQRAQFDPISGKLIGEQVAAPGYTANLGAGFGNTDGDATLNAKGELELKTGAMTNASNFSNAGLELHTPEYIWAEVDETGEPILGDDGKIKPYGFEIKSGSLTQKTPPLDGDTHYKQIYVKKMDVSTDNKDGGEGGDIVVQLRGGDDNAKLLSLRIAGGGKTKNASDVALAITSGPEGSHRETPVIVDAGSYQSTCRQGITEGTFQKIFTDATGKPVDMTNKQVQDTFKHFKASGNGELSSSVLLNRGISFKTQGHIIGTSGNDLFVQEEPMPYLGPEDPAYASVIEGSDGHNILLGKKGSVFANGMTMVSKNSGEAPDEISIGINAFGEYKDPKTGTIASTKGVKGQHSNAVFMDIQAKNSEAVAIQSVPDGVDDKGAAKDPNDPMGWESDDYYNIKAKVVATTAIDGNNPNQPFDPDLKKQKDGRIPIQGKITSAATTDFTVASKAFSERIKGVQDSIKKKASDNADFDWQIEGAKLDWMQGKYYKGDKNMLETFFGDFSASKLNEVDPFKQLSEGMDQAAGGDE
jgi:hypothetical protein